jgi:hypothetical protein
MFGSIKDFTAKKFTPTKWERVERKVSFARQFIRFVESDFSKRQFPHAFYVRLALTFGHIAHYNQGGFFDHFFSSTEGKVRFLQQTLQHPCCGDPTFTYCDVERAVQSWLHQNGILEKYEHRLEKEMVQAERNELARLQAKYGTGK